MYRDIWSLNPKFQNFMSRIDRLPAFSVNHKIYIVKLPRNWPKLQIFFKYVYFLTEMSYTGELFTAVLVF